MVNHAWHSGLINLPLEETYGQSYPILQYADDTLLIMPADETQLLNLKNLLQEFTKATGLKINFHKSSMVPINITLDRCTELASAFGCRAESLPFTYLVWLR